MGTWGDMGGAGRKSELGVCESSFTNQCDCASPFEDLSRCESDIFGES